MPSSNDSDSHGSTIASSRGPSAGVAVTEKPVAISTATVVSDGSEIPSGDGFLENLTDDEQRELLDLARQLAAVKQDSRSRLRHLGRHVAFTIADLEQFTDANVHVLLIERRAVECGDPLSIRLLEQVANVDVDAYPDRRDDAKLAQRILRKVDPKAVAAAHQADGDGAGDSTDTVYLRRGSTGPMVKVLQARLNRDYSAYSDLELNGEFTEDTEEVVKEFQRRSNLEVNGIAGPATLTVLHLPTSATDPRWDRLIQKAGARP
jgi:hypothetical protein